jgi:maltose alpha-D-glucosyltransferase/alpha-amylase
MQWSAAPHGGFCSPDIDATSSPVIQDPVYGHRRVNVEAQIADRDSLLNFMRHLIQCRKLHPALGRGGCQFLASTSKAVLSHMRQQDHDIILALHNLSDATQRATLELHTFAGRTPMDILTSQHWPRISAQPYEVLLQPYEYRWLQLGHPS